MAPAQLINDLDSCGKLGTPMKTVVEMERVDISETKDDGFLRCMNNCEDNTFDMDTLSDQHIVNEAVDKIVDIVDCADTSASVTQVEDPDATEHSSSFGNTESGSGNELKSDVSDVEVESQFHYDNRASTLVSGFDRVFRPRKKLTAHWRKYIRPLMWRCKWIELRLKEFQTQALKYDRELSSYSQQKQCKFGQITAGNSAARLLPLPFQSDRKLVMKRRKRKRYEDTVDLASYMLHHSFFSYYENKKSEADGVSIDDDCGNQVSAADQNANTVDEFGVHIEWPVLEPRDSDNSLEQILWNIDVLQSRVSKLQTQMTKLVLKNPRKFSSIENPSMLTPFVPSSSARSPTSSHGNGSEMRLRTLYSQPGHMSGYEMGDLIMPESAISSYGEASPVPDIIESTVNLLSAADISLKRHRLDDSPVDMADDVLIHNQTAEKELEHFAKINQPIDKPKEQAEEQIDRERVVQKQCQKEVEAEPVPPANTVTTAEEMVLRPCISAEQNVPRSKRKRAGRRGGLGRWNAKKVYSRRSSGGKK